MRDPRIARLVQRLEELPGYELFRFFDENGIVRDLSSRHVNAYVKRHAGGAFTAKDFRTWGGTFLAASHLLDVDPEHLVCEADRTAAFRDIVRTVAKRLGNTPAVTRSSYIDPRVWAAARDTETLALLRRARGRMRPRKYFSVEEQVAWTLLAG